jgi:hypothetical protein
MLNDILVTANSGMDLSHPAHGNCKTARLQECVRIWRNDRPKCQKPALFSLANQLGAGVWLALALRQMNVVAGLCFVTSGIVIKVEK